MNDEPGSPRMTTLSPLPFHRDSEAGCKLKQQAFADPTISVVLGHDLGGQGMTECATMYGASKVKAWCISSPSFSWYFWPRTATFGPSAKAYEILGPVQYDHSDTTITVAVPLEGLRHNAVNRESDWN